MIENPLPPLAVIILAAGKGTRMKSDIPKVMHRLAGKPMISFLIEQIETGLEPDKIIVVTASDMDDLRKLVEPHESVIQEHQDGTGDAVKAAMPALENFEGNVLIIMGDEPFLPMDAAIEMARNPEPAVMAIIPPDPTGLGRILMDEDGYLINIVEDKDCSPDELEIPVCNGGNFCAEAKDLKQWLTQLDNNNAQNEFYLTDIPEIAAKDGKHFEVFTVPVDHVWGVNDKLQLAEHERLFQEMMRDAHLINGVSMIDPDSVYFHHDTAIAPGVVIEPNVFFGPDVQVGKNVHIKAFCHFEGARIKEGSVIGPFARLRPGAELEANVKIGNFVEVKKSKIGQGSKINHLSYVGDCIMDENVNFSAGAITVNYDGYDKHQTYIGKNVMIGSNVNLVAPVKIKDGAFIAAGSTINEDIPTDALGIARNKPSIHEGWAKNYREKKS